MRLKHGPKITVEHVIGTPGDLSDNPTYLRMKYEPLSQGSKVEVEAARINAIMARCEALDDVDEFYGGLDAVVAYALANTQDQEAASAEVLNALALYSEADWTTESILAAGAIALARQDVDAFSRGSKFLGLTVPDHIVGVHGALLSRSKRVGGNHSEDHEEALRVYQPLVPEALEIIDKLQS